MREETQKYRREAERKESLFVRYLSVAVTVATPALVVAVDMSLY